MTLFHTVQEAAKLSGKSPSSIRRIIIYPILENDQHPDRPQIEPSPDDAKALRLKGENFPWRISEDLLRRKVPDGGPKANAEAKSTGTGSPDQSSAIIEMLRKELEIKNQQIATQNELLKGLSERLREGNILMGSLQQQLALTESSPRTKSGVLDAADGSAKAEKGNELPISSPTRKRGIFGRIFH